MSPPPSSLSLSLSISERLSLRVAGVVLFESTCEDCSRAYLPLMCEMSDLVTSSDCAKLPKCEFMPGVGRVLFYERGTNCVGLSVFVAELRDVTN